MIYDFHTHTSLSDGVLSPIELIRRASVNGYQTVAITDHVGIGYLKRLISEISKDCALAQKYWNINAVPGVELTHLPAAAIAEVAQKAKMLGAKLVVVHGETTAEPVEPGTNLAALKSPHVDILAHPGLITLEEARLATTNCIYLEITARKQHATTNKHVAETARLVGAKLIIDSDAHDEFDLLTSEKIKTIAKNASLNNVEIMNTIRDNPRTLLKKLSSL